jgi:glutaconate CoA-transferase subunit A
MTIAIGGFINSSHPMLIVRGLIKRGVKNLTVVGAASSGLEIDLLIAAGCARKVVAPYVGGEALAPIGPAFRAAAEKGRLEVFELDEAMYYAGCGPRSACSTLALRRRHLVSADEPAIKFQDPKNGETLLAIPAIDIDIAFLHAAHRIHGNVQYIDGYGSAIHAAADGPTQVEQIVSNERYAGPARTAIPVRTGDPRALRRAPVLEPGPLYRGPAYPALRAPHAWGKSGFRPPATWTSSSSSRTAAHLERVGIRGCWR